MSPYGLCFSIIIKDIAQALVALPLFEWAKEGL